MSPWNRVLGSGAGLLTSSAGMAAAGAAVALILFPGTRRALRKLAVRGTAGVLSLSDRARRAVGEASEGWRGLVAEARQLRSAE